MNDTITCQSKDELVAYLYDEVSTAARQAVEAHLAACEACRAEMEALTGVRTALTEWQTPVLADHFRLVVGQPPAAARPRWRVAVPLAAAAVLVLAAAAGLANLEIRSDAEGITVRAGWSRAAAPPATPAAPAVREVVAPAGGGEKAGQVSPWRADLLALEQQLRRDLASGPTAQSAGVGSAATSVTTPVLSSRMSDRELLERVQKMIDASEIRQQQNLALRVTELSRDFSVQRQADLVQIQQGLGRLEGRTEAEAARAREIMNYIVRVSQQPPR